MKRLLSVSLLLVALPVLAIESSKSPSDIPSPRSVFEKNGRDPFARIDKKKMIEPSALEKPVYSLNLNGITRENGRRYALVSGSALAEGETGLIRAGGNSIKVLCKEIRDNGVLVQVGTNSRVELQLGTKIKVDEHGVVAPK